jgi:hypothetical protein
VDAFSVEVAAQSGWHVVAQCQSIGNRRLVRIPNSVTTGIRVRFHRSAAPVALRSFRIYDCELW